MKWEYQVVVLERPDIVDRKTKLEGLGKEGWELVSVAEYRGKPVFYLKRPIEDEDEDED